MTKEEYLSQIQVLPRRIDYHNARLLRLQRQADAVTSRWGEHSTSASGDAPYVRMLENIEAAREELEEETGLLLSLQRQVEDTVNALPDERLRLVLLYHYLEKKTFAEIGEMLYVSFSSVRRYIIRALELLVLPEHPISIVSPKLGTVEQK